MSSSLRWVLLFLKVEHEHEQVVTGLISCLRAYALSSPYYGYTDHEIGVPHYYSSVQVTILYLLYRLCFSIVSAMLS
jgi:hypothetical protein